MAILGKIRQRSFILIVIIALALFSFVLADVIQSGGFSQTTTNVGTINGTDVSYDQFNLKVNNVEKQGAQQGTTTIQAMNQVWNQEINLALLNDELEKLGIRISESHLVEALKADQTIGRSPMFANEMGQFDINKYREYFKSSSNQQEKDELERIEVNANVSAKYQIYSTLLKSAFYTTVNDAKFKYNLENDKVTFDYVVVPFSSINDSEVTVSDKEITDFMKKNEKKYKSEETREIEFVTINDNATDSDKTDIKSRLEGLLNAKVVFNNETNQNDTLPGFRATTNIVEFVNANSDFPYDSTFVSKSDLPAEYAEQIFNLADGEVFGPYEYGNYYAVSRSMGRKAGAKARASHILISYEGTPVQTKEIRNKEQAKTKAEEILAKVTANPGEFAMIAMTESEDTQSGQRGGDLDFFNPGQMVKPFNDFVFNNSVGKIGLVESEFGFHIINITDRQDAIQLATIAQKIEASEKTTDGAYTNAMKFEQLANEKAFADAANEFKLAVSPSVKSKALDEAMGELGNQRQIVRWAFEKGTDLNDVKRFEIPKVGHVIARLKKINKEGLLPIEDARIQLEPIIKNNKKAELIKVKMKGTTLDAIAKAGAVTVQKAENVSLENPIIPNSGSEPAVVGVAFSTEASKVSELVQGNTGVYAVKTTQVSKGLPTQDYTVQLTALKAQNGTALNRVFPALKEKAKIKDNRTKFNY
ncbi:peptidylprolyl isomerase [Flavobacterium orientale]|uniref:Periplasmic chaperone PpiD n=1 Tax=Flavobacterium orientale TaxID=1756020 RepID=A0A916XXQ3_9FLAO|nr:peptidylprolyl isomerase [Flavobacterium orientale]GGD19961.1 peptidylprolyl isomerase [Flavobacterium orientale]